MAAKGSQHEGNWLDDQLGRLMGPSLWVLLGSSILRGLLGLLIGVLAAQYGTYNHWSPYVRLPIEIVVFFGVFITSDVCFASTIKNCVVERRTRNEIATEDPPKFRGTVDQQLVQQQNWTKQREQRTKYAAAELHTEQLARAFFCFVSLSYGLNFVLQSLVTLPDWAETADLAFIEVESLIVGVYVIWYYSARYRPRRVDPAEKSGLLIETAIEGQLNTMAAAFQDGTFTAEQLNLAEAGLSSKHPYRKFVAALRKPPELDEVMTTGDIYEVLGISDRSAERQVRRIIEGAYLKVAGVMKVPVSPGSTKTEWRVTGEAFMHLFRKYLRGGQATDMLRTNTARHRPARAGSAGQQPVSSQQSPEHAEADRTVDSTLIALPAPAAALGTAD